MTTINIKLDQQDPRPSAIYVYYNGSLFVGCAYDTHYATLNLYDKRYDNFFRYCQPCKFYRNNTCPGGERTLFGGSRINVDAITPDGRHIYGQYTLNQPCKAQLDKTITVNRSQEVQRIVKLPAYVLWSVEGGDLYWYLLNPSAAEVSDFWKGTPFSFANIYESGKVCVGNNDIDCRDFSDIHRKLMTMQFNTDLTYFGDQFPTLGAYAKALTDAEDQVGFTMPFVYLEFRDFRRNMLTLDLTVGKKAILPPIYNKVTSREGRVFLWDEAGTKFELLDNGQVQQVQ